MKKFILIFTLLSIVGINLMPHPKEPIGRLPWDSLLKSFPPFEIERIDKHRISPVDSIPNTLWENYQKNLSVERATKIRIVTAPLDKMPVIVPPGSQSKMLVERPETTFHFYLRNLRDEEIMNSLQQRYRIK